MAYTINHYITDWVEESRALMQPDKVLWIDGTETQLALEQYYTPSILTDTTLYYVGSSNQTNFYDDSPEYLSSLGIYRKDLNETGLGVRLVALLVV